MKINQWADLTWDEFESKRLGLTKSNNDRVNSVGGIGTVTSEVSFGVPIILNLNSPSYMYWMIKWPQCDIPQDY